MLVEQEVIERQPDSRFPPRPSTASAMRWCGMRPMAWCPTAIVRGPPPGRPWLERKGEPDPLVLATHHQLGEQPERAASFHTRAAEQLFERHDLLGTMRCVEAALAVGWERESLTRLRALQATAAFWMDQFSRTLELGVPVLAGLKAGSPLWCRLMAGLLLASLHEGQPELGARLIELLLCTAPEPKAIPAYVEAVALLALP